MYLIYLSLTCGLILINLSGLSAIASHFMPAPASRRTFTLLLIALVLFTFEHIYGLGKLQWLWPISTLASVWLLNRRRNWAENIQFWRGELVFLAGFSYGLFWRFCFPNIDSGSEHLTDLYFISNFINGGTLPPGDHWLAGNLFNFYYAFQHYCAALLGRIFNLQVGLCMNLSWAIIIGLMISLVWEIVSHSIAQRWLRALVVTCFLIGGNGLSPFIPWLISVDENGAQTHQTIAQQRLWASTRFSGLYDKYVNTSVGRKLSGDPKAPDHSEHQELPFETVAYLTHLGDYHPPLGGFVLLLWTLALFLEIEKKSLVKLSMATGPPNQVKPLSSQLMFVALGLTPALVLITNAWVFPLQCTLLLSWLIYRQRHDGVHWAFLLTGGLLGFVAIYPFLSYFAASSLDTPIRLVTEGNHTPLPVFLALHWPTLLWVTIGLSLWRKSVWCAWLALTLSLLLLLSEFIFVDDPMGDKYERFNTTLKWWSWLWPATLVGLLSLILSNSGHYLKLLVIISMLPLLIYGIDLARYLIYTPKPQIGRMAGDGWLKQDDGSRTMLSHLSSAPYGIVLESVTKGAYSPSSALTLFAHKTAVMGWPDHVSQWHGHPKFIKQRTEQIRSFFNAELNDSLDFLAQFPVQYVVWTYTDEQANPGVRMKINRLINQDYQWRSFYKNGQQQAGIWQRTSRQTNQEN